MRPKDDAFYVLGLKYDTGASKWKAHPAARQPPSTSKRNSAILRSAVETSAGRDHDRTEIRCPDPRRWAGFRRRSPDRGCAREGDGRGDPILVGSWRDSQRAPRDEQDRCADRDFGGNMLGRTAEQVITIDDYAAGYGWHAPTAVVRLGRKCRPAFGAYPRVRPYPRIRSRQDGRNLRVGERDLPLEDAFLF